jgi:hypothetical protein
MITRECRWIIQEFGPRRASGRRQGHAQFGQKSLGIAKEKPTAVWVSRDLCQQLFFQRAKLV